jgi:hypothetical protein
MSRSSRGAASTPGIRSVAGIPLRASWCHRQLRVGPPLLALAVLSLLALPLTSGPTAAWAQEPLDQVESLVDDSRYGEAREVLEAWWEGHDGVPPRTELARGLWYRALLTVDPSLAEMDYRRLVVEFPSGEKADEALLRLAQGAELVGDDAAVARYLQILLQDYPGSPHQAEARALRERILDVDREEGGPNAEAEPAPVPEAERAPEREALSGSYAVQLGAFSSREAAERVVERAREEGFEPRVVRTPGSDVLRVRVGAFEDRSDAEDLARTLSERGFETLISSDREEERPLG